MKFALVPALLLFIASAAYTGDKDKPQKPAVAPPDFIHWAHSWDEAVTEAKERNVPIHVAFHKDH